MCMSNERVISGNKLDTNELMSLVSAEQYDKLEEAWLGIVESNNKDLQSLFDVVELLIKREERKRAHEFLMMLVPYYKQKGLYHDVLKVLKKVLEYNPKEKGLAREIAECYSNIYKDRPYAKDLVEKTGIAAGLDIQSAMKKLEKYFYLDRCDYVYHKSWGVGEVVSVDADSEKVNINFEKKSNHSMAMDIAPEILQKLEKDDLLAMIYAQKEVLNKMIKKDPYIKLTDGTPTTSFIEFRPSPMTHHQEILEKLTHFHEISKKIEIAKKYISETKGTELCKETLNEITNLFVKEADKLYGTQLSLAIECLLLLEEVQGYLNEEPGKYLNNIESFVRTEENLSGLVNNMSILEYRKQVLGIIKKVKPEKWQDEFISIFFVNSGNLWEFIAKDLIAENKQHSVEEIAIKVANHFNAYPEHYIWYCKNGMQGRYAELYQNVDAATMFNRLIELLDNIYFKI